MVPSIITGRYPRSAYAVALNRGPRGLGSRHGIVVFGAKTAAGTGVDDTPTEIGSQSEALAFAGPGSQLHLGLKATLENAKGLVPVYGCVVDDAAGVAASVAVTLGGAATEAGTATIRVGSDVLLIDVPLGMTNLQLGALLDAAYNAATGTQPNAPAVGTLAGAVMTFTAKNVGVEGNFIRVGMDLPAGLTHLVGADPGPWLMTLGTLEADWEAAMEATLGVVRSCDYAVLCTNSAVSIPAVGGIRDQIVAARDPLVGHLIKAVFGCNTTEGAATTISATLDLGGTDFDEPGWACALCVGIASFALPCELAGALAGRRAAETVTDRNKNWGHIQRDAVLAGIPATPLVTDYPTRASIETMLASGCTPLEYDEATGTSKVVRSQTCKHITSGGPDFRGADSNIIDVMDYMAEDQSQALADEFGACVIADDVDGREPETLGANTVTASLMCSSALARYKSRFCGTLGWCDTHYRDIAGTLVPIDNQFIFERDPTDSSKINGINPGVVKRWAMQIGVRYEEIGY